MCHLHIKFGEYNQAKIEAEKVLDSAEKKTLAVELERATSLHDKILQAFNGSNWKQVETLCRDLITTYSPFGKELYTMRIKALVRLKEFQRAIDSARSKARIETDPLETNLLIGKLYLSIGNPDLGLTFVTECLRLDSDNSKCRALSKSIKSFKSTLESTEKGMLLKVAVKTLEELLSKIEEGVPKEAPYYDPDDHNLFEAFRVPVLKSLCKKHCLLKTEGRAIKVCEDAMKIDTSNSEFYNIRLAELFIALGNYDEAINRLDKARGRSERNREIEELIKKAHQGKREKMLTRYYDILGVPRDATEDQIRKAHKSSVLKWHPDKQKDASDAEFAKKMIHDINEAYDVLGDKKKRRLYDQGLDPNDPHGAPFGGFQHGSRGGGMHFADDFINLFNQQQRGRGRGRQGGFQWFRDDL